jgi:hypothetical protein
MVQAVNMALQQPVPARNVTVFDGRKKPGRTGKGHAFKLVHVFNVDHPCSQRADAFAKCWTSIETKTA